MYAAIYYSKNYNNAMKYNNVMKRLAEYFIDLISKINVKCLVVQHS